MSLLLDEIAIATRATAGRGRGRVAAHRRRADRRAPARSLPRRAAPGRRTPSFDPRFWDDIARREAREPLQHITGTGLLPVPGARGRARRLRAPAGDRGHDRLGDRAARRHGRGRAGGRRSRHRAPGAIALSIAQEVPRAQVHAVEADPLARQWTERNIASVAAAVAAHRGPGARCTRRTSPSRLPSWTARSTWSSATRPTSRSAPGCRPRWASTTRRPRCGVGADGMDAVRVVEATARRLLRPGGLVAVEHGAPAGRRPCTGCSPRRAAGGRPATTPTWPAATGLSRPPACPHTGRDAPSTWQDDRL